MSTTISTALEKLRPLDGYLGSCLVDSESGMALALDGGSADLDIELAAAGNTEVVRAKRKAMAMLKLTDHIEDMLVTLGKQYHLLRPLQNRPAVFFYVALDRSRANLAMARMTLKDVEKQITF